MCTMPLVDKIEILLCTRYPYYELFPFHYLQAIVMGAVHHSIYMV